MGFRGGGGVGHSFIYSNDIQKLKVTILDTLSDGGEYAIKRFSSELGSA